MSVYYVFGTFFLVFFFKHKTAYEVRIRDWSSDVCSSDLVGRPDLLTRHPPAVAVAPRRGLQRGQVGARVGLAEALTPDDLTPGDGGQVLRLLLGGAVAHDRWAHPVDPHVLGAAGFVEGPHPLPHRRLLPVGRSEAQRVG